MIEIKEEYKTRLQNVLTEDEFTSLMSLLEDRETFLDELTLLSVVHFVPGTDDEPSDETYELEELFDLIARDTREKKKT